MTRCVECGAAVSDDDDGVDVPGAGHICGQCVDGGINPHWAGPRDIDRSQKQSAKVKEARAEGVRKYDHIFEEGKRHG